MPGLHGQRLPSFAPEPYKIDEQDEKEVRLKNVGCGKAMEPCANQNMGQYQEESEYSEQEQNFVEHAGQATRDTGSLFFDGG